LNKDKEYAMSHPFQILWPNRREKLFFSLLALTLLLMTSMAILGLPLNTPSAPYGIISFELAANPVTAQSVLDSWDGPAKLRAAFIQGLDYLFLIVYSTAIGLACVWSADVLRAKSWPLIGIGVPLAWALWMAALCDAVENFALMIVLLGNVVSPWPEIAAVCAFVKFILIFLGITYSIYALVAGKIG
jgi:hypothetical protein